MIVFGKTADERLGWYREFCVKIQKAQLKLKPLKCHLFQKEIAILCHHINECGVSYDPETFRVVWDWGVPRTQRQVKYFLSLTNY